jgi:glycosyltransferase involved in cell wall biosynthesis
VKKILFIASHRIDRAPNQRFRFEQYMTYLEKNGFECTLSPLIATPDEDKSFYMRGNYTKKVLLGIKLALRRIRDVIHANEYDIIVIAREAFFTGSTIFERALSRRTGKIIFDFDDSIWLNVISNNNRFFSSLKDGLKTARIIRLSDKVFAGNEFLANYAKKFNDNVVIIPTTIDTDAYQPVYYTNKKTVTIGWSGSVSTIEHFEFAIPTLRMLKDKYKERIAIKVIGDGNFFEPSLNIKGIPWTSETELDDLREIDIGIMPLPDNEWTWGKCGLKGLQYMALEIPTIMSPVGVNLKIINDGVNGYLANSPEEWVDKISALVEQPDLRSRIGREGRKTVVTKYSVKSMQEVYLQQMEDVLTDNHRR